MSNDPDVARYLGQMGRPATPRFEVEVPLLGTRVDVDTTERRYRKKPVEVSAARTDRIQWIETPEGRMRANPGDYIITGIAGERYPCKPEIFEATYELVED